ncbi:hypothetical protein BOX15_Mlig021388g1 [Macrostomum lignano]|uniref:Uncharacterized protein n=1 Tax=Macrostomum lignano TaxID=282301 RepID=A0A267EXM5_9PLAT|nr:hypothetical protein BOX15_Mlig021388g1 [Macrostomum lignano]
MAPPIEIEQGSSIAGAVRILQIKKTTAFRIAANFRLGDRVESLPRGGRKEELCKADREMREFLVEKLDKNPY